MQNYVFKVKAASARDLWGKFESLGMDFFFNIITDMWWYLMYWRWINQSIYDVFMEIM